MLGKHETHTHAHTRTHAGTCSGAHARTYADTRMLRNNAVRRNHCECFSLFCLLQSCTIFAIMIKHSDHCQLLHLFVLVYTLRKDLRDHFPAEHFVSLCPDAADATLHAHKHVHTHARTHIQTHAKEPWLPRTVRKESLVCFVRFYTFLCVSCVFIHIKTRSTNQHNCLPFRGDIAFYCASCFRFKSCGL